MAQNRGWSPKAALAWVMGSLERRLSGALLLIVLCTAVLQVVSQNRAVNLHDEVDAIQLAVANAEHAEQLNKAISQFRVATHLYLTPHAALPVSGTGEELTDAAIKIGEQTSALRLGGLRIYELSQAGSPLDELDRQIVRILHEVRAPEHDEAARKAIKAYNDDLSALGAAIEDKVKAEREQTFAEFTAATHGWHMFVTVSAGIVLVLVLLILVDLLANILPALRHMHTSLRRLADGELDVEIGNFQLDELRALSGPLETFRRNALAVQGLAFTDPSTGMPNRRAFVEHAAARLEAGPCEHETGFAIFLADVDHFKHVNDDYGHAAGDRLARLVGERMTEELGSGAMVARVGGDEFAMFAPLREATSGYAIGANLVTAMRAPFDLGGFTVGVTISLGFVETAGGPQESPEERNVANLMHKADLALYASKNGGRNRASAYTRNLEEEREVDRELERDIALAFDLDQFRMVYQPIHPTAGRDNEVEALVRWRHPQRGDISPTRFIPAAERSNQMVRLGSWIVERALADLSRWGDLTMSINLSPLQLQQDGFVGFLMRCCRKYGITPRRVILEVTETLSIERNSRALVTLNLLRNAGFRIALDDFGTGYSSLLLMKTFRFDRLKIDRSLIADLGRDATSQAVFDAAVTMALKIGAEVVAEGISEEELVDPALSAGCTHLQGFHYSRPIEADEVELYFARAGAAIQKVA